MLLVNANADISYICIYENSYIMPKYILCLLETNNCRELEAFPPKYLPHGLILFPGEVVKFENNENAAHYNETTPYNNTMVGLVWSYYY